MVFCFGGKLISYTFAPRSRAAVARRAHNPKVLGSIPSFATTNQASKEAFFILVFTVYILYSAAFDKIYTGYTSNLEERFLSHNELGTKGWTIKFRPWKIIHTEEYKTKAEALIREKSLKSGKGREWIKAYLIK